MNTILSNEFLKKKKRGKYNSQNVLIFMIIKVQIKEYLPTDLWTSDT